MRLDEALARMARLTGHDRSIASCEALWNEFQPLGMPWGEAYLQAKQNARPVGADRYDGRAVAFLEGFMAATLLADVMDAASTATHGKAGS